MDTWRSAITNADGERVLIRGHDVVALSEKGGHEARTDVAGRTDHEDAHVIPPGCGSCGC